MAKPSCSIVVIDAGNTRIKWAFYDRFAVPAEVLHCGSAEISALNSLTDQTGIWASVESVVFCCVAGENVAKKIFDTIRTLVPAKARIVRFRSMPSACGVRNGYDRPSQLGADRFAALIAAWHRVQRSCLVVCMGTATTVDFLDVDQQGAIYRGGLILPGFNLMVTALASSTADLPIANGNWYALPSNTGDAIISGCINAQAGAITKQYQSLPADTPCLITGGSAEKILPYLDFSARYISNLVLEGLNVFTRSVVCPTLAFPAHLYGHEMAPPQNLPS